MAPFLFMRDSLMVMIQARSIGMGYLAPSIFAC